MASNHKELACLCTPDIQCWICTARKVIHIGRLEERTGVKITTTAHYQFALNEEKRNEQKISLPSTLRRIRKRMKLNSRQLGEILGVSGQFVSQMERGVKPLNTKALGFIGENTHV